LDPDQKSKIGEKLDPQSMFIFDNCRRLHVLHNCHSAIPNVVEIWLHQWFPEFEHESDFHIWKRFGTGYGFKIFGTGVESESANMTQATCGADQWG